MYKRQHTHPRALGIDARLKVNSKPRQTALNHTPSYCQPEPLKKWSEEILDKFERRVLKTIFAPVRDYDGWRRIGLIFKLQHCGLHQVTRPKAGTIFRTNESHLNTQNNKEGTDAGEDKEPAERQRSVRTWDFWATGDRDCWR